MSSALHVVLLFSALWTLSLCVTHQLHVVNERKNWTEAQKHCRKKFNDLVTIESREEMDAFKAAVKGITGVFWIGLSQSVQQNNTIWTWSDKSTSSYRDWNTREPNNLGSNNCGALQSKDAYKWHDADCYHSKPFVCYKETQLILIKQNKTWWDALRYCRENHVDLASVHTEKIQRWVEAAVKNVSTDSVWVGLRHTCVQSLWFWVSGWNICYQNWAPGNGTGGEDCSEVERSGAIQSGSKQWVSLPETQKLYFICTTSLEL